MLILGVCGSPRVHGNTETRIEEAFRGAQSEGAETQLFRAAGKNIRPCQACDSCRKTGACQIQDDMQELYPLLLAADGIIFGAPVYFYGMTAQIKAIIDRTIALQDVAQRLSNKVGGVIVTAGSLGVADTLKDLYFYMITRQMIPANFVAAYPDMREGFKNMEKTRRAAFDLGRQMVKIRQHGPVYPSDIPRAGFGYGTHTR